MEISSRAATLADLNACAALIDAQNRHFAHDFQPVNATAVQRSIEGYFEITQPFLFFPEDADAPCAFAAIHGHEVRERFFIDFFVAPDRPVHEQVIDRVLAWCESCRPGWDVYATVDERVVPITTALVGRGFRGETLHWTMSVPLTHGAAMPELPEGITLETIDTDEQVHEWFRVSQDAFSSHPGFATLTFEQWAAGNLGSPSEDLEGRFLLRREGQAIGYIECTEYRANLGHGYVDSLGVVHAWHGRGYGHLLLRAAMAYYATRGRTAMDLTTDSANPTGAVSLYRGVGMEIAATRVEYIRTSASSGAR